jgi:hypothetical protein
MAWGRRWWAKAACPPRRCRARVPGCARRRRGLTQGRAGHRATPRKGQGGTSARGWRWRPALVGCRCGVPPGAVGLAPARALCRPSRRVARTLRGLRCGRWRRAAALASAPCQRWSTRGRGGGWGDAPWGRPRCTTTPSRPCAGCETLARAGPSCPLWPSARRTKTQPSVPSPRAWGPRSNCQSRPRGWRTLCGLAPSRPGRWPSRRCRAVRPRGARAQRPSSGGRAWSTSPLTRRRPAACPGGRSRQASNALPGAMVPSRGIRMKR